MRDNRLVGEFPIGLTQLSSLATLTMYGNDFSGTLPREIGRLSNLVSIDLSNNNFSGNIPAEFGRISTLEALNLNYNNLSGTIPQALGDSQRLNWIDLSYNNLSGSLPTRLARIDFINIEGNPGIGSATEVIKVTDSPSVTPVLLPTLVATVDTASATTASIPTPPVTPAPFPTEAFVPTPTAAAVTGELLPLPPNPVFGQTTGRFILSFSADKSPASQGDEITLTWETQNTKDVFLSHSDFVYQEGVEERELISVPASGSYVYTLSEGRHDFSEIHFELLININDFQNQEAAMLTVKLNCRNPRASIMPNEGPCPSAPAVETAAVGQHFQSGLIIHVKSENRLYVFKESLTGYNPGTFETHNNQYAGAAIDAAPAPPGMLIPQGEIGWSGVRINIYKMPLARR